MMKNNKYVVLLLNPENNKAAFLHNEANIKQICYQKDPKLPGTGNINKAKQYNDVDEAKADIYLLKYHFRFMLKTLFAIIPYFEDFNENSFLINNKEYQLESKDNK